MNWDAFGAFGEWAGAIAVVITLVYLGRQIHQQNKIAKFSASQSIFDSFGELTRTLGCSTELNALLSKGTFEPEKLSDDEARQFQYFNRSYLTIMIKAYNAYELRFIDDIEWQDLASEFARNLETPGGILFRKTNSSGYRDFWNAIDAIQDPNYERPDYEMGRTKDY